MNAYSVSLDFTKPSLFTRITLSSQIPLTMATTVNKTVRVAAAQMTSVNDLMTNFATCSRLVQVILSKLKISFRNSINRIRLCDSID